MENNNKPPAYVAVQQTYKVSTNFDVMPQNPPRVKVRQIRKK